MLVIVLQSMSSRNYWNYFRLSAYIKPDINWIKVANAYNHKCLQPLIAANAHIHCHEKLTHTREWIIYLSTTPSKNMCFLDFCECLGFVCICCVTVYWIDKMRRFWIWDCISTHCDVKIGPDWTIIPQFTQNDRRQFLS